MSNHQAQRRNNRPGENQPPNLDNLRKQPSAQELYSEGFISKKQLKKVQKYDEKEVKKIKSQQKLTIEKANDNLHDPHKIPASPLALALHSVTSFTIPTASAKLPTPLFLSADNHKNLIIKTNYSNNSKGIKKSKNKNKTMDETRTDIIEVLLNTKENRKRYEVDEPFHIYAGTWNTNGQKPTENLEDWLGCGKSKNSNHNNNNNAPEFKDGPDLYVLAFQELDLTKDAYLYNRSELAENWTAKIEDTIGKHYKKVQVRRLAGILLCIFIRNSKFSYISQDKIHFGTVGTGLMNQIGNKGGVAISMKIKDTSICCVGTHLAAQMDNIARRNQDFHNVMDRMFKDNLDGQPISYQQLESNSSFYNNISLINHDVILWLGDLNYRMEKEKIDNESFMQRLKHIRANEIQNGNLPSNLTEEEKINQYHSIVEQADQLTIERKIKKSVFQGFEEAKIGFAPTYKYDIGTDTYDTSEKARQPAWCDRILYKHNNNQIKKIIDYRGHMGHKLSDHKPVSAKIYMNICAINKSKRKEVQNEIHQQLDSKENSCRPSCKLSETDLQFGDIHFRRPIRKSITIENDGSVPFKFSIALPNYGGDRNSQSSANQQQTSQFYRHRMSSASAFSAVNLPDWLKINIENKQRSSRVLLQGEKRVITFEVVVDTYCIRALSLGLDKIDAILVLSMEKGGDKFITVSGNFKPSIFGLSLEELSKLENTPIRDLTTDQVRETCCKDLELTMDNNNDINNQQLIKLKPDYIQTFNSEELEKLGLVSKELYKLCHRLINPEKPKKNSEIFMKNPPGKDEAVQIFDALENGNFAAPLTCASQHGIAEQFLVFLSALPEKVIPRSYYMVIQSHSHSYEEANKALNSIPKIHKASFLHIMKTLRELLKNKEINHLSEDFVVTLFGNLLLAPPDSMVQQFAVSGSEQNSNNSPNLIDLGENMDSRSVNFDWALAKQRQRDFIRHFLKE